LKPKPVKRKFRKKVESLPEEVDQVKARNSKYEEDVKRMQKGQRNGR